MTPLYPNGVSLGREHADNSALADKGDVVEGIQDIVTENKAKGTLKIIFWNSNGWEQERCEK